MVVLLPLHIDVLEPALAEGNGFMVIFLKEESWQLDALTFSRTLPLPELPVPQDTVIAFVPDPAVIVPPCTTHV